MRVLAAFFVCLLFAAPASACHAGPGIVVAPGFAFDAEGPALATIRFGGCDGVVPVTMELDGLYKTTVLTFDAQLDINLPKGGRCLAGVCGGDVLAGTFTLRNETVGLDLTGGWEAASHIVIGGALAGTYRGLPASFVIASI